MAIVAKYTDIIEHVDLSNVQCLNEKPEAPFSNALRVGVRDDDAVSCQSDTDEQLLMYVPFHQNVKLYAIKIKAVDDATAPRKIRLFVNKPSLGFSEASSEPAAQELELDFLKHCQSEPIMLKFVKFQNVSSVTVFVDTNQDDEESTKLEHISFIGTTVETTNMNDLKKVG